MEEIDYCNKCSQPLGERIVAALGKEWHPECFICNSCKIQFGQNSFSVHENHPYCAQCYTEKFQKKCEECHKPLGLNKEFMIMDGKHLHITCFNKMPGNQCSKCGDSFGAGRIIVAMDKRWHPNCFVCRECEREFGTDRFHVEKDSPYCKDCFQKCVGKRVVSVEEMADKTCAKCSKPFEGSIVTALDKKWHPGCFVCAGCSKDFGKQSFHVQSDLPYCDVCYTDNFQPTCEGCQKKIAAGVKYTTYNEKCFHNECFCCAKCKKSLSGKKFALKGNDRVCLDNCK